MLTLGLEKRDSAVQDVRNILDRPSICLETFYVETTPLPSASRVPTGTALMCTCSQA